MAPLVPRPAATLILLRDSAHGPEVLMMQRSKSSVFLGGAYVFPGGSLDTLDSHERILARVRGAADDLNAYRVAAVRECFEESGVLLLQDAEGRQIAPGRAQSLLAHRKSSFADLLEKEDLYVPGDALALYGHWITAPGAPRRFDARFFVAIAPAGQEGSHDEHEAVHQIWVTPRDALARAEKKEIELVFATRTTLAHLASFQSAADAFAYARELKEVDTNRACWAQGKDGAKLFRRADPAYFEIHWADPEETGQSTYDLTPGAPKKLDRWVTRLIAPNPGMMTGPGTNTYLVGDENARAVIDPGPAIESHLAKILESGNIKWILCTHTHLDHSPAAAAIKAATGAQVIGRIAPAGQDATFRPDRVLENGERVQAGAITLRALHTPGHASNHLCYLLEDTRMLFTGDHVMQGSTVVINPPDGDMREYLASLERLLAEDLAILAPGHGYLIGDPHREIRRLIAHRLGREKKVVAGLARLHEASLEELVPVVYDDVPPRIHGWAARSLTAHLDKLVAEGAVRSTGGRYALVKSPPPL
jgi:glyoxylase-like metal-dependent hydrolase (beta-lactamase superfamily II)/8-oxo-dGTP pyrophosphatase MutT (NUDIX family)